MTSNPLRSVKGETTIVTCKHCENEIAPLPEGIPVGLNGEPVHLECFIRVILGSARHQMQLCHLGGCEDPSEVSAHDAAKMAALVWAGNLNKVPPPFDLEGQAQEGHVGYLPPQRAGTSRRSRSVRERNYHYVSKIRRSR